MKIPQTLTQFLIQHLDKHPEQRQLVMIMADLASIGKILSHQLNNAGTLDIFGETGTVNATQDNVKKLDIIANDLCINFLRQTNHFSALASEEEKGVVDMGDFGKSANYVIAFDPIDGSKNIDVNVGIGTIFSIHKRLPNIPQDSKEHFLQKGRDQVGAGYILYGTSTVIVFSFGDAVHEFTLNQGYGEFLLSRADIKVPETCGIYSVNDSNLEKFDKYDQDFIASLRNNDNYTARYIGSMVADFHRNIIKGGIYMYPAVNGKPKLRLNHELKAMAFLIEHAGGLASDGIQNILDIKPESLHERTSVILGNKDVVQHYINNK